MNLLRRIRAWFAGRPDPRDLAAVARHLNATMCRDLSYPGCRRLAVLIVGRVPDGWRQLVETAWRAVELGHWQVVWVHHYPDGLSLQKGLARSSVTYVDPDLDEDKRPNALGDYVGDGLHCWRNPNYDELRIAYMKEGVI